MPSPAHSVVALLFGVIAASTPVSVASAQCVPPSSNAITVLQDTITGPNAIGFSFPFQGATYTDIHISDHGICFLTNGGVPAVPSPPTPLVFSPASASLVLNGPVICPLWADSVPGAAGMFYIDNQPAVCSINWLNIISFGLTTPMFSFQMKLHITGVIEFVYGPNVTNNSVFGGASANGVVGVSPGFPLLLPSANDLSSSPSTIDPTFFEQFTASAFDMAGGTLALTPAATGLGWLASYTVGTPVCASGMSYGAGCDGLTVMATNPALGSTWVITNSGINPVSALSFTYLALAQQVPPLALSTLGLNAPGCSAHIALGSITAVLGAGVAGGMSTVSLPITSSTAFVNQPIAVQTVAVTTSNAAGVATSNGWLARIGF